MGPAGRYTVRIVLDANLLVSAVFGGLPALAVERASREEVWISPEVRREWLGLAGKLGVDSRPLGPGPARLHLCAARL